MFKDGPVSSFFMPVQLNPVDSPRLLPLQTLPETGKLTERMAKVVEHAPRGEVVGWGIPFNIQEVILVADQPLTVAVTPLQADWLVFMHTSDFRPLEPSEGGFISPMRGEGYLNEHAADYVLLYEDGSEERIAIRRRHQIGTFDRSWGENCFQAVPFQKLPRCEHLMSSLILIGDFRKCEIITRIGLSG